MFGFVIDEMFEYMLLLLILFYKLMWWIVILCKDKVIKYLCLDVKVEVMVEYDVDGKLVWVDMVVLLI